MIAAYFERVNKMRVRIAGLPVVVWIEKITRNGLVTLKFNQKLMVSEFIEHNTRGRRLIVS